jgi:hypothetical protein
VHVYVNNFASFFLQNCVASLPVLHTMGRQRAVAWKTASGDNTVDKIYEALTGALPNLFMMIHIVYNAAEKTCTGIYTTDDMNKHIDEKCLLKWKACVTTPLLSLDPRGGFFAQEDMVKAIQKHGKDEQNVSHIQKSASEMKLSEYGLNTASDCGR